EKLEAATAELDEKQKPLDELARHFRGAGLDDKALDYARRAGKRAIESYANDAAVEHLLYAKELQKTPEIEVMELLSEAFVRKGESQRGAEILREALAVCGTAFERSRIRGKLLRCLGAQGALTEGIAEGWRALEDLGVKRPRTRVGLILVLL